MTDATHAPEAPSLAAEPEKPEAEIPPINHFQGPNLEAIELTSRIKAKADLLYRQHIGIVTITTQAQAAQTYDVLVKLIAELEPVIRR